jgi:signal transduction histidine kinase
MLLIFKSLWPRNMVGQIVVVAAIALFAAQAMGAVLLMGTMRARALNEAAIVLTTRMGNYVERQAERGRPIGARGQLVNRPTHPVYLFIEPKPLAPAGFEPFAEFQQRATDMFEQGNIPLTEVRFSVGPLQNLPREIVAQQIKRAQRRLEHRTPIGISNEAVLLSARTRDGQWISGVTSVRPREARSILMLLLQTVLLYLAVLIPLLLMARRIAKPLVALKQSVQRIGANNDFEPIALTGPDDVRNLVSAFNNMQIRVASLLSEKDVMLGAIGHDLKTPLASLRVRIESVEDDEERDKMAATVEEMTQMLDDILTLARNGNSGEAVQRTDIGALTESVTLDYHTAGQPVEFAESEDRIILPVRPILLRRAIRNLIDNAVQHGGNAMVAVKIADAKVRISIDDNGPGIPDDQIEALFEPFARAEQSRGRATGGSGLGLTIARAIARNLNGDITLRNRAADGERPSGLTALISLPVV